jgi:hypothetical protein
VSIINLEGVHYQDDDNVQLAVELSPTEITVRGGPFRVNGVDYVLAEDQVHELPKEDVLVSLAGHLVKDKKDGTIAVFVDEMRDNHIDVAYDWESSEDYEHLYNLFHANVVPGVADIYLEVRSSKDRTRPKPYPLRSKRKKKA